MILVWGSGEGRSVMGDMPATKCATCGQMSPRTAVVLFKYFHLWYLFSFLTGRDYMTICNSCGGVAELDKAEADANFPSDNIPFLRKRGWMLFVGAILAIVFFVAVGSYMSGVRLKGLLESPAVGDLYAANLAKIPGSGYEQGPKPMYGGMLLVRELENGSFLVATSDIAYDMKSGWRKEGGKVVDYSVSGEDGVPLMLSSSDLIRLHSGGVLYEGKRDGNAKALQKFFESLEESEEDPEEDAVNPGTEA